MGFHWQILRDTAGHAVRGRTPFQTVRADFPHTAYRMRFQVEGVARDAGVLNGSAQAVEPQLVKEVARPSVGLARRGGPDLFASPRS